MNWGRRPLTVQEWVIILVGGLLVAVAGLRVLGLLFAVVGAVGLVFRLVSDRQETRSTGRR